LLLLLLLLLLALLFSIASSPFSRAVRADLSAQMAFQVRRYLGLETLMPSHANTVTQACLWTLAHFQRARIVPEDPKTFLLRLEYDDIHFLLSVFVCFVCVLFFFFRFILLRYLPFSRLGMATHLACAWLRCVP
jgi:hypothetical protein